MKIVRKSNFDHEDHRGDEWFVAQKLTSKQAHKVAELLQDLSGGDEAEDFFVVVEDDYQLKPEWQP